MRCGVHLMGSGPDRMARLCVSLEDHSIVVAALRQTRTEELGDMGYAEALRVLSRALDSEAVLAIAGRRSAKALVVDLLVRRAAVRTEVPLEISPTIASIDPIVVCGLPGSGASQLRRLLGSDPRVASTGHRFDELDLRSMGFESRWHVPAYAEWLQGSDPETHLRWVDQALRTTGDVRRPVVGSWIDVERLDTIRTVWPNATIVVVTIDPATAADTAISVCRATRAESGSRRDVDVIERYWRWRVSTMSDRLATTLDVASVVASPRDFAWPADPTDLLERIIAWTA